MPKTWKRWLAALLCAISLTSTVAAPSVAATAQGDYELRPVYWGSTDLGRIILEYRARHPEISDERNVAVFEFREQGRLLRVVGPSVSARANPRTAPIEVFDENGNIVESRVLTEADGVLNKHAEEVVRIFLGEQRASLVTRGESELKPCQSAPNQCRLRLRNEMYRNIQQMNYNIEYGDSPEQSADGIRELSRTVKKWVRAGRPIASLLDSSVFTPPGTGPADGPLVNALSDPNANNGGIDLRNLELRYLADPPPGEAGLRFAFSAPQATGQVPGKDGQPPVLLASDAFFVFLSLPESTFWVNLNPDEPDRIVDAKLGSTDVGRVLLEADLQLKKTVAALIHPDTAQGRRFWDGLRATESGICLSFRQWIVPAPASVRQEGGELYILDAPLSVELESEYLKGQGGVAPSCAGQPKEIEQHNEALFRSMILPGVRQAVNTAPEYADLRRVYLSRVAAEWYRDRGSGRQTMFSDLIGSSDVRAWPARKQWSPREVFDRYVKSYTDGEFKVTHETQRGNVIETQMYIFGGVDFSRVPYGNLDEARFRAEYQGLPETARQAQAQTAAAGDGRVWLGSVTQPRKPEDPAAGAARSLLTFSVIAVAACLVVVALLVVLALWIAKRTRVKPRVS